MSPAVRWLVGCLVVLGLLVGAFSAGRFSAPLKVETRDVERVVYKDKIVEKLVTVEVKGKTETKIVYRDRVITKDGTVTEREVEKTIAKEDTKTTNDGERVATREGETVVTREKTTTLQPDWRVGLLLGASINKPFVPIYGPVVLGLQVERRILGGLSLGVWVNTVGAAGSVVSLEF